MTITDISTVTLPDATLTPAERAWDAIGYMEAHPDEVNMECWGEVQEDGRTIGCFAHHVVKRAGLEFIDIDDGRMFTRGEDGTPVHVSVTAALLLGLKPDTLGNCPCGCDAHGLFTARGDIAQRAQLVEAAFGPRPVAA